LRSTVHAKFATLTHQGYTINTQGHTTPAQRPRIVAHAHYSPAIRPSAMSGWLIKITHQP